MIGPLACSVLAVAGSELSYRYLPKLSPVGASESINRVAPLSRHQYGCVMVADPTFLLGMDGLFGFDTERDLRLKRRHPLFHNPSKLG